jgi:hypothetical protein
MKNAHRMLRNLGAPIHRFGQLMQPFFLRSSLMTTPSSAQNLARSGVSIILAAQRDTGSFRNGGHILQKVTCPSSCTPAPKRAQEKSCRPSSVRSALRARRLRKKNQKRAGRQKRNPLKARAGAVSSGRIDPNELLSRRLARRCQDLRLEPRLGRSLPPNPISFTCAATR